MLEITHLPLNQTAADRIRKWLGQEGAHDFALYLRTMAAIRAAEAGNRLCEESEDQNFVEARQAAEDANRYRWIAGLMGEMRSPDFQFETVEIIPHPPTNQPPT